MMNKSFTDFLKWESLEQSQKIKLKDENDIDIPMSKLLDNLAQTSTVILRTKGWSMGFSNKQKVSDKLLINPYTVWNWKRQATLDSLGSRIKKAKHADKQGKLRIYDGNYDEYLLRIDQICTPIVRT